MPIRRLDKTLTATTATVAGEDIAASAIPVKPHIQPGVLQPAVAGKLLDGTTSHGATYGVAQSDGHSYYYTDIKGSKPIKDPRIGSHFGSQRHKFKSVQILEQETATHGSDIYSVDGREWIRQVGYGFYNNLNGNFLNLGDTVNYYEITAYCSGINLINLARATATFRYTVDGGTEVATDYGANSLTSYPLGSRFVDAGSVSNLTSGLTLGIHTIKIRRSGTYGEVYGIELIAQDTSSTANKSKIQIPAQNVVSYGKKFAIPATAQHYDPFNGFTNGTTLHSAVVDTATSLGLDTAPGASAKWAISNTNNIRPYNGGRVVKWIASDGTIKTSVNMMPPNAQNIGPTASAEITTPSATNTTYLPAMSDDAIDHSQAEVAKTFHIREFGNGSANGNANYADPSTVVTDGGDDLAYVMDDGLTSFSGASGSSNSLGGHATTAGSGIYTSNNSTSMFVTFIGTGLSGGIDNTTVATRSGSITNVAQNLPYGTHIVKLTRGSYPATTIHIDGVQVYSGSTPYTQIRELTFHQPKMPPIPEDAVVIADYMLMADFVPIGAEGLDKISKGIRLLSGTRDVFYDGGGSPTFNLDITNFMGMSITASSNASNLSRITSFAPNVVKRLFNVDAREQAFYINDTAHSSADATTEDGSGHGAYQYPASVTLGNNIFETHGVSGGGTTYTHAYEIATPIHTSSHYQTFETPYLHELVGGDRNMEQTNLVVTSDGKSWDEVTRDTSYIGKGVVSTSGAPVSTGVGGNIFDEWRGTIQTHRNCYNKDFAIAYDRIICLVSGEYNIEAQTLSKGAMMHCAVYINGSAAIQPYGQSDSHDTPTVSLNVSLKRGDYIQNKGGWYGSTLHDHYQITRI